MRAPAVIATLTAVALGLGAAPSDAALSDAAPRSGDQRRGGPALFQPADKQGYGTAYSTRSKVWFTLRAGGLSDLYYPLASTPAARGLQLVVTDGRTFTDTEAADTRHQTELLDRDSLTYRQVNTAESGDYRIVKTYVADPARSAVKVRVRFTSLTGDPYRVYVDSLPALDNAGHRNTGRSLDGALVALGPHSASALTARPALGPSTSTYQDARGGLAQLRDSHRLLTHRDMARRGTIEQTARTGLTGVGDHTTLTLSLGFGRDADAAKKVSRSSLRDGFGATLDAYQAGWHGYLDTLKAPPASLVTQQESDAYRVSAMVLAAAEDKTYRGAFVASPSMPWVWGDPRTDTTKPTGPYHLVWARDLYQIATGLLAAGDRAAARRSVHYLFTRQQKPDGSFPQNSTADGRPYWTSDQLDEWALPIVLAWQLGPDTAPLRGVRRAADAVVKAGPNSEQERWENQDGYSPATIAAQIAGLVCAADIARAHGKTALANRYLTVADRWQGDVKRWTATRNGPLDDGPYFLRVAKEGKPNRGIRYGIGDSGPSNIDQRRVVDPSFLELVRLGVLPADDPVVLNSIKVVDQRLRVRTPYGPIWHRFSFDGYGETAAGGQWVIEGEGTPKTYGRLWPLLSGERGEYALAAGLDASRYLRVMAASTTRGLMMPEQVWDGRPPTDIRHRPGSPTMSAMPLMWTHAQFIRLAWDIDAGVVVEQPEVVAERYTP